MEIADIDDLDQDQIIKARQWRNLYFLKTGESLPGVGLYPTEREAFEAGMAVLNRTFPPIVNFSGHRVPKTEISHLIPMPIG